MNEIFTSFITLNYSTFYPKNQHYRLINKLNFMLCEPQKIPYNLIVINTIPFPL